MKEIKINELVILKGRIYKVDWTKWDNGKMQGNRAILKLLDRKELDKLLTKHIIKEGVKNGT